MSSCEFLFLAFGGSIATVAVNLLGYLPGSPVEGRVQAGGGAGEGHQLFLGLWSVGVSIFRTKL